MQCISPIRIHPVGEVPCGKCIACRIRRTNEWGIRIMQECSSWEHSSFLTLTYDNMHLPADLSLRKDDLQKFFKRLRFDIKPRKVKYYACGEYGDRFKRPHYHAIVFGLSRKEVDLVNQAWGLGFVKAGTVTYESARYVAGYVQKKLSGTMAVTEYGDKARPFQVQSQGIGKAFCTSYDEYLIDNLGMTVNGVFHSLPRYYRKVLGDKLTPEMLDAKRKERDEELKAFLEARGIPQDEAKRYLKEFRAQKESEINSRLASFKHREF